MTVERMLYRRYKQHFSDCETVEGNYSKTDRTIEVILPEGRLKPSGVRGQTFKYMEFTGTERSTGREVCCLIKAACAENAIRRLPKDCVWRT